MRKVFPCLGVILGVLASLAGAQIANNHPGDINIHQDAKVVFAEMFEESTLDSMRLNWTDTSLIRANIVFDTSVPPTSPGHRSLRLITVNDADTTTVKPPENTYLYKRFPSPISDSVFVRFYIRYDSTTRYHHSGVMMGGRNPASNFPNLQAGALPAGNKQFQVSAEVRGTTLAKASTALFGFYNYSPDMHASTQLDTNGNPYYWGNQFLNSVTTDNISMSAWTCVEVMIRLNNPVSSSNGEVALWINGIQVNHLGPGYPTGSWNGSDFTEGAGPPFTGFQWRTNDSLKFNYLWLSNYVTNNVNHTGSAYFDHIVVARSYIGPILPTTTALAPSHRGTLPHYAIGGVVLLEGIRQKIEVFDGRGFKVREVRHTNRVHMEGLPPGIYGLRTEDEVGKILLKP